MYRKALTLTLLGVLVMGAATVTYGTANGKGLLPSLATVVGVGDDEEGGKHDRKVRKHKEERHHD